MMEVFSSTSIEEAAKRLWDATVIGAGPAGALSALLLARKGLKVLLIERDSFPRYKPCGCCLSALGVEVLRRHGLSGIIDSETIHLKNLDLRAGGVKTILPLAGGVVIPRERLDSELVKSGVNAGVTFISKQDAKPGMLSPDGKSRLVVCGAKANLKSKVVIWAGGLRLLDIPGEERSWVSVKSGSPVGAGAALEKAPPGWEQGKIHMLVQAQGYVGLVVLPDGRLNIGAALRLHKETPRPSTGGAIAQILRSCGLSLDVELDEIKWTGMPPFTRKCVAPALPRLFAVGDAAGYLEPFTGEGMSWALLSAEKLQSIASAAVQEWRVQTAVQWENELYLLDTARKRTCRYLSFLLGRYSLFKAAAFAAKTFPAAAKAVVRSANHYSLKDMP